MKRPVRPKRERTFTIHAAVDPACGIYSYARNLIERLREAGVSAELRPYAMQSLREQMASVVLHNFELGQSIRRPLKTLILIALLLRARFTGRRSATIVHCYYTAADLRARLPTVIAYGVSVYQTAILRTLGALGALIAPDESIERCLREAAMRATTIELGVYEVGVNRPRRDVMRSGWDFEDDAIVIGLVGHPMAFKRYGDFVRLIARVGADARSRLRLVYVGGDNERDTREWNGIMTALRGLPRAAWRITGKLDDDDFAAAVSALDVCVMPYRELAQASAVLAAVAGSGTPCLVSDATLFDNVVAGGGAVRLSNLPDCLPELLASVLTSLDLPRMRERMNSFARTHSLRSSAERLVHLLESQHG